MRRAYEIFAETLAVNKIQNIFGLMGDANMQYLAHYLEHGLGRFHSAVHEATGVSMADGFARFSGGVGVASVTHGPGLTNAITPLKEAVEAHTPLLLLTGEPLPGRGRLQAISIEQVIQPTGAAYECIYSADTVADDLCRAIVRSVSESRPVVLNFPVNLLSQQTTSQPRTAALPNALQGELSTADMREAAVHIRALRRPLILAGMGAVKSGAHAAILELAEEIGAPVSTTLLAKGFFDGQKRNIGVLGGLTSGNALSIVKEADGVIVFGAALNRFTAGHDEGLLKDKTIIQCDIRPERFGAQTPIDLALLGDARTVAAALANKLQSHVSDPVWDIDVPDRLGSEDPMEQYKQADSGKGLSAAQTTDELIKALPLDRNIVSDLGRFITAPWRHIGVATPGAFTHSGAFGSIGLGLGTAIGAAIATPNRLTVLTVGDGALMMGIQELSTAVRLGVPLLIIVFNDGSYGAEYSKLQAFGHDPSHSLMSWPDLTDVARAFGAQGLVATSKEQVAAAIRKSLENLDGPTLIDVHVDPRIDYTNWYLPVPTPS